MLANIAILYVFELCKLSLLSAAKKRANAILQELSFWTSLNHRAPPKCTDPLNLQTRECLKPRIKMSHCHFSLLLSNQNNSTLLTKKTIFLVQSPDFW